MGTVGGSYRPLVATKLAPPRLSGQLVERPRLLARLGEARNCSLVLITAPAGWGKTTLAAAWRKQLVAEGADVAWLQLGPEENDLYQFTHAVTAALHQGCGLALPELIEAFGQGSVFDVAGLIAPLVNSVECHKRDVYLVIDDCHRITEPSVLEASKRVIELAPVNLHLVLLSRSVPALPLSKIRLDGRLVEIGTPDLRFTLPETETFVSSRLGLALSADDLRLAHDLSEGWPAGLQLLATTLKSAADKGKKLREALSHQGAIGTYLTEEVMAELDGATRDFLVRIGFCQRVHPDLCEALSGAPDAGEILTRLEADFHFLQPLDDGAEGWLRFNPIVRGYLRERFSELPAETQEMLHRTASRWFGDHHMTLEAVRHALLGKVPDTAVALAEEHVWSLFTDENQVAILSWIRLLPRETVDLSPRMMVVWAWTLILCRRLAEGEEILARLLRSPAIADPWLRFCVASIKAVGAVQRDDGLALMQEVADCQNYVLAGDDALRASLCNLVGFSFLQADNYAGAREMQRISLDGPASGSFFARLYGAAVVGLSLMAAGEVTEADRHYAVALREAEERKGRRSSIASTIAALYAETLYEQNRLEELRALLANRMDLVAQASVPDSLLRGVVNRARLAALNDGTPRSLEELDDFEALAGRLGLTRLKAWALAEKIRLMAADWRLAPAQQALEALNAIAAAIGEQAQFMMREVPLARAVAQARLWIAGGDYHQAVALLEPIRTEWEGRGRMIIACQLRCLRSIALHKDGQAVLALAELAPALEFGQAHGLVRSFLDEGPNLQPLLAAAAEIPALGGYAARLIADLTAKTSVAPIARAPESKLILSAREADILQLMGKAMTNKRIAIALEISGETVKWHIKNIFAKLDVITRADAIAKARRLGLID